LTATLCISACGDSGSEATNPAFGGKGGATATSGAGGNLRNTGGVASGFGGSGLGLGGAATAGNVGTGTALGGHATSSSNAVTGGSNTVGGTSGNGTTGGADATSGGTSIGGSTLNGGSSNRGGSTATGGSATGGTSSQGGSSAGGGSPVCPVIALNGVDARTLTGASTPLQLAQYGVRNYSAPVLVDGKHSPSNYQVAPALPKWQFATVDPTQGKLTELECAVAPAVGFHGFKRKGGSPTVHEKVIVTGGRDAAANRIYTVFNGQQLIAALGEAGLEPKIVRVVGHIDLRMSVNNTKFAEYTSYSDQKYGGSISIPSNTTLVGINDAAGNPARITGTSVLIGGELALTATGDPEADFKAWVAAGKDGDAYPTWTRNVIVRNLKIDTPWDVNPEDSSNAYADGMTISRSQNVWIDHVTISDGDTPDSLASDTRHDGSLDIVRGSDYVTVSNSFFGDHGKNSLVGNGDSGRAWSDLNRLHVTFTGLWWYGIASRHPLVRFGQLHTFNNLMQGTTGTPTYGHKFEGGLDVRYQSDVISENNFHLFIGLKPKEVCGKLAGGKDGLGFRGAGNQFISDKTDDGKAWTGGPISVDAALAACAELPAAGMWTVPYVYSLLDAAAARVSIVANCGAGRIGPYAKLGS
jgi:pectate lyase